MQHLFKTKFEVQLAPRELAFNVVWFQSCLLNIANMGGLGIVHLLNVHAQMIILFGVMIFKNLLVRDQSKLTRSKFDTLLLVNDPVIAVFAALFPKVFRCILVLFLLIVILGEWARLSQQVFDNLFRHNWNSIHLFDGSVVLFVP